MKNGWFQKVLTIYTNYRKFMTGRYGYFDQINKLLIAVALIALLLRRWLNQTAIWIFVILCIMLLCYRFFSKKIYVRSNENQRLLAFFSKAGQKQQQRNSYKKKEKQRKDANIAYVVFNCDHCGQALRVPQGKGKIKVTCNNCHHTFYKQV